jgi:hypothetical protein
LDDYEGGHAVVVIGYNKEGFILMNSWGATWNGDGTIVFPYDEWESHWECWVSVDEKTETPPPTPVTKHRRSFGVSERCHIM